VAASLALGQHRRSDTTLDVLDEGTHYDYVIDLTNGHIPAWGDLAQQRSLRLLQCDGTSSAPPGNCKIMQRNPATFFPGGYDYEAQQPPLGYIPYALMARPDAPPRQAIVAARRGGEIWTVIAAIVLVGLAVVEELSILEAAVLLIACLLCPVFVHAAATVNNDSASLSAGALSLLVGSYARRHRRRMIVVGILTGLLIGLTKGIFVVAPFVLLLADLIAGRPWHRRRKSEWVAFARRCACDAAMFAGATIAYVGWTVVQDIRARVPSTDVLRPLLGAQVVSHLQPHTVLTGLQQVLQVWMPYYSDAPLYAVWNVAMLASLAGLIWLRSVGAEAERSRALAISAVVGLIALALGWPLLLFIQGHFNYAAASRYALPLVPLIGLLAARSFRDRSLVGVGIVLPTAAGVSQLLVDKF
jgi:hypothetical protein